MPPFRNPFVKKPSVVNGSASVADEIAPQSNDQANPPNGRGSLAGSRTSSSLSIKPHKEPDEFKLSGMLLHCKHPRHLIIVPSRDSRPHADLQLVVNDSGVYLPPSPTEKKGFWSRTPTSTTTSSHRSMLSENEPFSISRESFESYRRSFDISARSPVSHHDSLHGRQSLDSRTPRTPRSTLNGKFEPPKTRIVDEEPAFEDVGLNDEAKPKKRGLFARFGDSAESPTSDDSSRPGSSHRGFHLPGRKRAQSGQDAELGSIPKPGKKEESDSAVR